MPFAHSPMFPFKHYWFKAKLLFLHLSKLSLFLTHMIMLLLSTIVIILTIYELGFDLKEEEQEHIRLFYHKILAIFFLFRTFRIVFRFKSIFREKGRWVDLGFYAVLLAVLVVHTWNPYASSLFVQVFRSRVLMYVLLLFLSILEISKRIFGIMNVHIPPGLLFAYSFLLIIAIGTGMLMLPRATVPSVSLSLIDAVFTATSAVCITGLGVVEFASAFTPLGQGIILGLIQIGGIGMMTFTSFFALSFMGHSSFQNNLVLKDMLNVDNLNSIFRTLLYIILTTLGIELVGTAAIYYSISGTMGMDTGNEIFFSVFHSISGFCNAGWSTLGGNLYTPLVATNYTLHMTIALLVILGGLGFPIILNFYKLIGHFFHNKWLQLTGRQKCYAHTKIIHINTRIAMYTTLVLLVAGFVLFFAIEYNHALRELPWQGKIVTAFFGSVTPRTAGFVSVNLNAMMPATILLTVVLMWIGASPMSTGGGIKTTTFAIACMNIINTARGKQKMEVFRREVSRTTIQRAFAVIALSILGIMASVFCISVAEPQADLRAVFLECFSAVCTAGLSLNLTPTLCTFSKVVLIVAMFVGRVGALTIISGLMRPYIEKNYGYPQDAVMVG